MNKIIIALLCISAYSLYGYEVRELPVKQNIKKELNPTYYTPDGKEAVYLSHRELGKLAYAMRNLLDNEQEYNTRISKSLIQKLKAACQADGYDTCQLIDKVLGDFIGKRTRELFLSLGLRTNL